MRYLLGLISVSSLAACTFATQEAGAPPPGTYPVSASAAALQGRTPAATTVWGSPVNRQPANIQPPASNQPTNSHGLSDEQDFGAVSGRESIESDAQRLEGYQAAYTQVEPQALPQRPRGSSVSIVKYALETTNAVGQQIYSRSALSGSQRAERNCARYTSADFAQIAFLEKGGPKRDKLGLDPDGDGFACSWNPVPFRAARNGGVTAAATQTGVSSAELEALGIGAEDPGGQPAPLPGDALNISGENTKP